MAANCIMPRTSYSTEDDSIETSRGETPTSNRATTTESAYDTALPQLAPSRPSSSHFPVRISESSARGNLRSQRPPYSFQNAQDLRNSNSHRRTGSTLKTVMRRIFTRKRRSQLDECDDPDNEFRTAPTYAGEGSLAIQNSPSSKQSSPPQKTGTRPTTLEVIPDGGEGIPRRRRRATLPSLVFSENEPRDAIEGAVYLDKSMHDREPVQPASHSQDDLRSSSVVRLNRRSRSANALSGEANAHRMSPIQWTRASAEISRLETRMEAVSDTEISVRPPTGSSVGSAAKTSTAPSGVEINPNIGHLVNSMQHDENASLEQRLTTLEVKLIDLEFAIARMQSQRNDISPGDKPRSKKSPTTEAGRSRHARKRSSSYFPPVETVVCPHTDEDRPRSTTTVRPNALHRARTLQIPSSTCPANFNGISVEQYSALVMLLRREQSARRTLESQVSSLRDDMQQLQRVARDSMGVGTMYPIHDSQEYLRFRDRDRSTSTSLPTDRNGAPYDSDSDRDRSDVYYSRDDFLGRPKWERNPRIEVAGMI